MIKLFGILNSSEYKGIPIMIIKEQLERLYTSDKLSMQEIASTLGCSVHKVVYWMDKYNIQRRSISDAVYQRNHPNGDPFEIKDISTLEEAKLLGLGLGLYWGEGNKKNKNSIRLGNTDPQLIKEFIRFLVELFGVNQNDLRFGLQIFTDINPKEALNFWVKELAVDHSQFGKVTVTISGSIGTYRNKSQYGVLTVHYHNTKLRRIIGHLLPT